MSPSPSPSPSPADVEAWIDAARQGSSEALGRLLEWYRTYLLLVADREMDPRIRAKLGPSDLVQDTLLEAQRDFARFQGRTADEWRAWLHRLLHHNVLNAGRMFRGRAMRQVAREVPLAQVPLEELLPAFTDSASPPGAALEAAEEQQRLRQALEQLGDDYRTVIRLRHEEALTFEEIGRRLGRSVEAARKLWARAVLRIRDLMQEPSHEPG